MEKYTKLVGPPLTSAYFYTETYTEIPVAVMKKISQTIVIDFSIEKFVGAAWSETLLSKGNIFILVTDKRIIVKDLLRVEQNTFKSITGIERNFEGKVIIRASGNSTSLFSRFNAPPKALLNRIFSVLNNVWMNGYTHNESGTIPQNAHAFSQTEGLAQLNESLKPPLKWVLGIGFAVAGLGLMFSTSFPGGLLFVIGGLVLLPPTLKMIEERIGRALNRQVRRLTVIGTIFIGLIFISNAQVDKEEEEKKKEQKRAQEAFEKLPQHVKDSINLAKARQDSIDNIRREQERVVEEQSNRKEKVESQFSSWDGSHPRLTRLIKQSMNDPDSYEHVETRYRDDGNSIFVITKFRGKNAFGGKVINTVSARVDFDGNVIEIIGQE